ncbi:hypothetical protein BP00DRAFT_490914 [Aspergillus indologenus CBS 114.80]|uniref:Protein kinase domain-containing protein n=1 Tax=Aspergillus indologenus CBS 114.80 TaxID=1450541 RepID=A0A2V5HLR4_9EURO|nr:hypothetical protein BP00DRAFT_490914 [Aspergillus indologenus CBS 114.80]
MSAAHLELKSYSENQDFLAEGKTEPSSRSQILIYYVKDHRWWIKVTLFGTIANILDNHQIQQASKRQRRILYQGLFREINYESLPLLRDTVTEIILEGDTVATRKNVEFELDGTSSTMEVLNKSLGYRVREDPLRKINNKELIRDTEIACGVFRVYYNKVRYILKIELENLEYFAGVPNIVQAAGVAVSTNPYVTLSGSDRPLVVTRILLKAYSGGSLRQVLLENRVAEYAWRKWPAKKTHMDIKPLNIVIDSEGNAVLLSEIGLYARDDLFAKALKQVADCLIKENCQTRMSLTRAISRLKGADNQKWCTIL